MASKSRLESPRNLAKRLFDKNKREKEKTVEDLISRSASLASLRNYLIRLGATALVGEVVQRDRRVALGRDEAIAAEAKLNIVPPVRGAGTHAMLGRIATQFTIRSLLNFPLPTPGNKLLRDANAAEVIDAAHHYRGNAKDMLQKSAWLAAVAAKLPSGKVVGDVFDNRALNALYNNTCAGEPGLRGRKSAPEQRAGMH